MQQTRCWKESNTVVKSGSKYLFARPGSCATPLVGHAALTAEAKEAKIADHKLFTSTALRKHMATMAQTEYMAECDVLTSCIHESHGIGTQCPDTLQDERRGIGRQSRQSG